MRPVAHRPLDRASSRATSMRHLDALLRSLVLTASLALGTTACTSTPSESGIRLGDDTLGQFKVGEATEDWVIAVIGPPTTRTDLPPDPNGESISILRYTSKEEAGGLTSLFSGSGSKTIATVYFIVRDGLVTQMWADRAKEKTLLGQSVEKQGGEKQEE
jgi:hypothetical protein